MPGPAIRTNRPSLSLSALPTTKKLRNPAELRYSSPFKSTKSERLPFCNNSRQRCSNAPELSASNRPLTCNTWVSPRAEEVICIQRRVQTLCQTPGPDPKTAPSKLYRELYPELVSKGSRSRQTRRRG